MTKINSRSSWESFVCTLIFSLFVLYSIPSPAKNMTAYLNELNAKYNHKIAFSPNITDTEIPKYRPTGKTLEQI